MGRNSGDQSLLVALDEASLLESAISTAELQDFGGDDWLVPFRVFLSSLNDEGNLHTTGKLLARSELVRTLINRLYLIDTWQRDPAIESRSVSAPTLVTGTGRSGTSLLLELLNCDPHMRAPLTWEMQYPESVHDQARGPLALQDAHRDATFWNVVTPEYQSMHENGGDHPNECIFMTKPTFVSDHWMGTFPTPSYGGWLARADRKESFRFHKKFLQYLQGSDERVNWLLKAPSHLSQLIAFFAVYPDAHVIVTHRDPLRVLGSITDLMATLQWQKTDDVDYQRIVTTVATGTALVFELVDRWRNDGTLPASQVHDVRYCDLVADPISAVRTVYRDLDRELTPGALTAMKRYVAQRNATRSSQPSHDYSFAETGLDYDETRHRFSRYMQQFDLPLEVIQ